MSILSQRPATTRLPITALGPHFGAEIHGIDLARLDDDEVLALREALVAYKVLFVRGQHDLHDAAQIEFGRRLGEVTVGHPIHDSGDVAPEVYALDSQDNGFADVWHTDVTFVRRPPPRSPSCERWCCRPTAATPTGPTASWRTSRCPRACATSSTR
ncbi:TauD/TfdA family dioxygenase [Streptomyces sp. NPDC028635]|uniref:TauD/TfdA dioxygenase family protein n=1 Tax=Streptomyces sp. NPDC028635 TaxID=3154800 RepID=UPI0033FA2E64